jgi:hypothetical protein
MGNFFEGFVSFLNYKSNSWLQAGHFPLSFPVWPIMKIRPIVLHRGHMPVVTFFGPVLIIFWVFLLPITNNRKTGLLSLSFSKMARRMGFEPTGPFGHGISNPTPYQARRPPHKLAKLYL